MRPSNRELELKLELTDAQIEQARANRLLIDVPESRCSTQMLRSIYYDTLDWRLRRKGISLRLRHIGDQWVQTVKADRRMSAGVSNPLELDTFLDHSQPVVAAISNRSVRKGIQSALGRAPLVPQFETVVERTRKQLRTEAGDEIEVAIDKGVVRSAAGSKPIQEVELELKSGNPAALVGLAATLVEEGPLRVSACSKADLGYLTVGEEREARPLPRKAEPVDIDAAESALDACREICRSATRQIIHNWRVVLDQEDPEGPHQMRVGIRRLRTALDLPRTAADAGQLDQLDGKLRDLARQVGDVRDVDVLGREIIQPILDREPSDTGLSALSELLSEELSRRRDSLRAHLASRKQTLLQIEISLMPESLENLLSADDRRRMERPIAKLMRQFCAKSRRRVAKRGSRLDVLSIEERHALRKDLKQLRYAVEFGEPLFARREVRAFLRQAARLQEIFGYLNDVAMARKLPAIPAVAAQASPDTHRAVGFVIGWHEAKCERAWETAQSSWKHLVRCDKPWA